MVAGLDGPRKTNVGISLKVRLAALEVNEVSRFVELAGVFYRRQPIDERLDVGTEGAIVFKTCGDDFGRGYGSLDLEAFGVVVEFFLVAMRGAVANVVIDLSSVPRRGVNAGNVHDFAGAAREFDLQVAARVMSGSGSLALSYIAGALDQRALAGLGFPFHTQSQG